MELVRVEEELLGVKWRGPDKTIKGGVEGRAAGIRGRLGVRTEEQARALADAYKLAHEMGMRQGRIEVGGTESGE